MTRHSHQSSLIADALSAPVTITIIGGVIFLAVTKTLWIVPAFLQIPLAIADRMQVPLIVVGVVAGVLCVGAAIGGRR